MLKNAGYDLLYRSFDYNKPQQLSWLSELVEFSAEEKKRIIYDAVNQVNDFQLHQFMVNMSKLEVENKCYNWYHGYTEVKLPFWDNLYGLMYEIFTSATTGSIKTQHFGGKYYPDKIERKLYCGIVIYPPPHVLKNPNYTLTLEIEKMSMVVSEDSREYIEVRSFPNFKVFLDPDQNNFVINFTAPDDSIHIYVQRDVSEKDIKVNSLNASMMAPGFSLKWTYNQLGAKLVRKFMNNTLNVDFRR